MSKASFYGAMALTALLLGGPACAAESAATPAKKSDTKGTDGKAASVRRIPDTLMFTVDELTDIQNRLTTTTEEVASERTEEAIENAALYLSTIVYYGPKDWTIWVNNKPIGPSQDFSSFKITGIGPRYVELVVPLSANGMRPVRLEPNQTFISKSGDVVEGLWKP